MDKLAVIKPEGDHFVLYSHEGKVLGTHPTREAALRQEVAISISKRHRSMNKIAEAAFYDELEKISSPEALNKKRYWQILKKLYGGTKSTMRRLSYNRDSGIYHGSSPENIESIKNEGLKASVSINPYKKGMPEENVVFFGSKERSDQRNSGALFRLKKPSELNGAQYPKTDVFNGVSRKGKISKKEHRYMDTTASIVYGGDVSHNIITEAK